MKVLRDSIAAALVVAIAACHGTEPTYSVSGSVSGSTGPFVVKLNGANDISLSSDGSFKFTGKLLEGKTYNVQIVDPTDHCTVSGGSGTVAKQDITGVAITCAVAGLQSFVRSANLNGSQESQPVTTNALGVGGIIVIPNATNMAIAGGVTFSGVAPVQGQVNIQSASGAIIVPLTLAADGLTAVVPAGTTLNTALLPSLLQGGFFFNVASAANPNGEIRGPIELQGGVGASVVPLDKGQVVPPTTTAALGTGTLLVDLATGKLVVSYITHTVANATTAAIHTSTGHASNGLSVVPFTNLVSNIDASGNNLATPLSTTRLTSQNLADFGSSLLYFDVLNGADPNSEIRGNITPR
jgi:hypothetical protein